MGPAASRKRPELLTVSLPLPAGVSGQPSAQRRTTARAGERARRPPGSDQTRRLRRCWIGPAHAASIGAGALNQRGTDTMQRESGESLSALREMADSEDAPGTRRAMQRGHKGCAGRPAAECRCGMHTAKWIVPCAVAPAALLDCTSGIFGRDFGLARAVVSDPTHKEDTSCDAISGIKLSDGI